jgi:hypothetical protein
MVAKGGTFEHIIKSTWPLKPAAYWQREWQCSRCGRRSWHKEDEQARACTTCSGTQQPTARRCPSKNVTMKEMEAFKVTGPEQVDGAKAIDIEHICRSVI